MKKIRRINDLDDVNTDDLIIIDEHIGKFLDILKSVRRDSTYEIKVLFVDEKELVGGSLEIRNYKVDEFGWVTKKYSSQRIPGFSETFGVTMAELSRRERERINEEMDERYGV